MRIATGRMETQVFGSWVPESLCGIYCHWPEIFIYVVLWEGRKTDIVSFNALAGV